MVRTISVAGLAEFHSDENLLVLSQVDRTQLVAHPQFGHHGADDFRRALQIALSPGIYVVFYDFDGGVPAQHYGNGLQHLGAAGHVEFLFRE